MLKRFFITGTDTSVGKTVVSRALLQALASQGKTVAGYKPVAKGSKETPEGLRNKDALVVVKTKRQYLAVASGGDFSGTVCLVVNVASCGEWACLRGLWWRLCLHGVDVAARCGWRETESL